MQHRPPLPLLFCTLCPVCAINAPSPSPPYGLPPWAPGAAPPVPGPVFSDAFKALLVLLVFGCIFLGVNLWDAVKKMQGSDIGTDNELLTRGDPGNSKWLKSIQGTKGRHSGVHCSGIPPVPLPKSSKKPKSKGNRVISAVDDDDDDDAIELASLKPSSSRKKRTPRPKR